MAKYNDLNKLFEDLQKAAESIEGTHDLSDILTDEFVSLNTSFASYEELVANAPIKIKNEMSENEIELLDDYVASNTNYSDWQDMLDDAGAKYAKAQLKKKGF